MQAPGTVNAQAGEAGLKRHWGCLRQQEAIGDGLLHAILMSHLSVASASPCCLPVSTAPFGSVVRPLVCRTWFCLRWGRDMAALLCRDPGLVNQDSMQLLC